MDPNYMTPDVTVAFPPIVETQAEFLVPPAFLAVEIVSPGQRGLFTKAQRDVDWGVQHVWILQAAGDTLECFEHRGGNQFTLVGEVLEAGPLRVRLMDLWAELAFSRTGPYRRFPITSTFWLVSICICLPAH